MNLTRKTRPASFPLFRHNSSKASTRYTAVTHPEDPKTVLPNVSAKIDRFSQYLLNTYARPPFILSHGRGSWVWDTSSRKYLDMSAGIAVNALGHADPELARIMGEQATKLMHTSNLYHNEWAGELAELLVKLTRRDGGLGWTPSSDGDGGARVFLANSGTEANEGALKIARKVGRDRWAAQNPGRSAEESPKTRLVCFEHAFHGRSMGALSVTPNTKYQAPFQPLIPNVHAGALNDIEALEGLVTEDTCGVIVEPIQGEGGVRACSEEFLRALRKRCDAVGAVLIFDEIQCGLYRSGSLWAHSSMPTDCHPDIVTMAKPMANGFPLGAILTRDSIAEVMTVGSHGTTFGGSVLAARLGHHVLSRLSEPSFLASMNDVSKHLHSRLSVLPTLFPDVLEPHVRGRGFILGLPFKNREDPGKLVKLARERGVLLLTAGNDAVRIVPSLNVTRVEVDLAVDVTESSLGLL
ncbi:hypothetical protein BS47DRAFT_85661 [Hydnum rufescens UP504]|uniref:Acetylornithine transaminase n=1 Tax=Hydnum rufescens UP504 TaxID=1448309 RepID=A0A9P6B7X9_9AGAM|nr:hypothetical protein BS47DRAFT_85661 [Hydnum rufescens UP504]